MLETCSHCGTLSRTRRYTYRYGLRKRGINPRTLKVDHRPLGQEVVLLCFRCRARVFLKGLAFTHGAVLVSLLATALGIGWLVPGIDLREVVFGTMAFVVFWVWRHERSMTRVLFETRRMELAAAHGCSPIERQLYGSGPADQHAGAASAGAADVAD